MQRSSTFFVGVAAAAGLLAAAVLLSVGVIQRDHPQEMLEMNYPAVAQRQALRQRFQAAKYVDEWSKLSSPDFTGPAEILAAKAAGVPVCYPNQVIDKSGKLHKYIPHPILRQMQKPMDFNVVPTSMSSKLACICESCKPYAGFPPVCTGCKCEEALAHEDRFIIGKTKACKEGECEDLEGDEGGDDKEEGGDDKEEGADDKEEAGDDKEEAGDEEKEEGGDEEKKEEGDEEEGSKNALLDFPECDNWSCYNKDGWFCACTCPGHGC